MLGPLRNYITCYGGRPEIFCGLVDALEAEAGFAQGVADGSDVG